MISVVASIGNVITKRKMIQPQNITVTRRVRRPVKVSRSSHLRLIEMTELHRDDALQFLSRRPLDSVIMAGWIRANGVVSPLNRGKFYCCVDRFERFQGVALIGSNTLIETENRAALELFARTARASTEVRMVMARPSCLETFWRHFDSGTLADRVVKKDSLVWRQKTVSVEEDVMDIRVGTLADIESIVTAHAAMVLAETGVDPLLKDPDGFRSRCRNRVESGKVWVYFRDGEMIFKIDIVSETDLAVYAEGIWVHPAHRGQGIASSGLRALCSKLLNGSNALCGYVDDDGPLPAFYAKNGFTRGNSVTKVYL